MFRKIGYLLCVALATSSISHAQLLSEFEPNPAGGDPSDTTIELSGGTTGNAFDLWILSIENDGLSGSVDRASNVTGTYGAGGLAVVTVPDLENPSFTVVLTDSFSGAAGSGGTDIDPMDDGMLDLSTFGTILDAVGVSDNAGDDATLYGAALGGANILFNGEFEPLNVFRDSMTGDWYQTVTVDFNGPNEHVGIFGAAGGAELDPASFTTDPLATSFGSPNATAVPEPAALALLITGIAMFVQRKR